MIAKTCFVLSAIGLLLYLSTYNRLTYAQNGQVFSDSALIAKGELTFNQYCVGCHNFRQDGIGPQLGGLTTKTSPEWIRNFIKNPQDVISSGDERAQRLFEKYKVVMPSFTALANNDLNAIIAFLNTKKSPETKLTSRYGQPLSNPIPEAIKTSKLVANLELVATLPPSSDSGKLPLARITKIDFQPVTKDLFILDLRGKLYRLLPSGPKPFMDMAILKPAFIHQPGLGTGFGSFAFHPQFVKNGLLYTTHTEPAASARADFYYPDSIKVRLQWVLTEWKCVNLHAATFSGTGRELLRVNMVAANHGVQEITFNPFAQPGNEDYGLLYIGVGDGGSVEQGFPFLSHDPRKIWGTVLRIDPSGQNSTNGQYGIPSTNPFADSKNTGKLGEIYAYGFRNPHRITWAGPNQMLVCNIGHGNIESVNLVSKGKDYGWPLREGTFAVDADGDLNKAYPLPLDDSAYHITYPVAQYDHDEGRAISGGLVYRGSTIKQLTGKYIFGDIYSGRLFYIEVSDIKEGRQAIIREWKVSLNGEPKNLDDLCGSKRVDLHFGRDAQGELYIMTKADGKVYKIVGASNRDAPL